MDEAQGTGPTERKTLTENEEGGKKPKWQIRE